MPMPARPAALRAPVAVLAMAIGGCGAGAALPEVPAGYATYARDGVEFRYPRGWLAERAAPTASARGTTRAVVQLRPPDSNPDRLGARITLRIATLRDGFAAFAERSRTSAGGSPAKPLELEVPGAEEATGARSTAAGHDRYIVVARAGAGTGVSLEALAPDGDDALEPGAVIGSLRVGER
jgi:hypothetical protein